MPVKLACIIQQVPTVRDPSWEAFYDIYLHRDPRLYQHLLNHKNHLFWAAMEPDLAKCNGRFLYLDDTKQNIEGLEFETEEDLMFFRLKYR